MVKWVLTQFWYFVTHPRGIEVKKNSGWSHRLAISGGLETGSPIKFDFLSSTKKCGSKMTKKLKSLSTIFNNKLLSFVCKKI